MAKREKPASVVLPDLGIEDAFASLLMLDPIQASEIHPAVVEALGARFAISDDGWMVPSTPEVAAWLALDDNERARRINLATEVQRILRSGYTLMRGKGPIVIVRIDPIPADVATSRTVYRLMSNAVAVWASKLYRTLNGGSSGEAF